MITVEALYKTLDEMKTIYPYKDEKTVFELTKNPYLDTDSVIKIETKDEETGIWVQLAKDASMKVGAE